MSNPDLPKGVGALVTVCLMSVLPACKDNAQEQAQAAQAIQSAQVRLAEQVEQLDARLQTLETRPQLDFLLSHVEARIKEKMFDPILVATAELKATGDSMPRTFYVDVMLKVEAPDIQYEAIERQIFPVHEGKSLLKIQQRLPQHGMVLDKIQVTLKPVTWYRGQVISDERITYQ